MSKTARAETIADVARKNAIHRLALKFKCSSAKAEERMQRPDPKYKPYRVAFILYVEHAFDAILESCAHGEVSIAAPHWSAVIGTEAERAEAADVIEKPGMVKLVSYWFPGASA